MQRQSVRACAFPKKAAHTRRRHAPTPLVAQHQKFTVRVHFSRRHAVLHSAFIFFVRDHLRTVAAPSTSGSPCSSGWPCVKHWWKGAATLQIRALHAIGTASEPPASQAFKPAPYSLPVHVLTVLLALVDRVQSGSMNGSTTSKHMMIE